MEVSGRKDFLENQRDIFCQPCHDDGDNVQAEGYCDTCNEYFCSSCLNVQRKQSFSRNHVIRSKDEMPGIYAQGDSCLELCAIHKTEIVKFYCECHNEVGCGYCMVVGHKLCNVQLVSNVSGNYSNSEDFKSFKLTIEELEIAITSQKREIRENMKATEKMKEHVIKEIKLFRSQINSYLDRAEAELLHEIEELTAKDVSAQKKIQDECEHLNNEINDFQSKLEQYSEKMNQLFVTVKLALKKLKTYQESSKHLTSEGYVKSYKFEPSNDLTALKASKGCIGAISVTKSKKFITQRRKDVECVCHLNARAVEDIDNCSITGLAMISGDEIVLVDNYNCSIKILNVSDNKITSRYKPGASPLDVTVIKPGTVAVTFPCEGEIRILNTIDSLSVSHSLKVMKGCGGIDHKNDIIAVTFCDPAAVQILNMEGRVLYEVNNTSLFSFPGHIVLNNDNKSIFVSDRYKHAVYELTLDGKLIATMKHENLKYPMDLVMTSDGTIAVCCDGVVIAILPNTREVRSLSVKPELWPVSLLVCEEQNKLYISSDLYYKDCNNITVLDLK